MSFSEKKECVRNGAGLAKPGQNMVRYLEDLSRLGDKYPCLREPRRIGWCPGCGSVFGFTLAAPLLVRFTAAWSRSTSTDGLSP